METIALILLATSIELPDVCYTPELREAITRVAKAGEIADDRFTFPAQYVAYTMKDLRSAYQAAKRYPLVGCAARFRINSDDCIRAMELNSRVQTRVRNRIGANLLDDEKLEAVLQDLVWRYQIYEALSDAVDDYRIVVRRKALRNLRDLIGEEDFSTGKLPDVLPAGAMEFLK